MAIRVSKNSPSAGSISEEELVAALDVQMPPRPLSPLYRLGMVMVAIAMVMLPLIYIGLIGCTAYGLVWHAQENITILDGARGRDGRGAFLLYITPFVVGGILLIFMIKPLFAGKGKSEKPRTLNRKDFPLLFAFVERLAQCVGAPPPHEIQVDTEVNASASLRKGIFSRDLVLTIGLPLAAGMTLRQFSGILAHEFGHFSQGAGMRLTFVIRWVSMWFARVVYERDAWDDRLIAWSQIDIRLTILIGIARFFVWVTRKILWVLMVLGHTISCFMLRQMEYDADSCETWLSGSEEFEKTTDRMVMLGVASQAAHSDLSDSWSEGRLADDLPSLILANVGQLDEKIRKKIRKVVHEEDTGLFDTHPSHKDRIEFAAGLNEPGIFQVNKPAIVLFDNKFEKLCKDTSLAYYQDAIGKKIKPSQLIPVGKLVESQTARVEEAKSVSRFFQNTWSILRPLHIPEVLTPPLQETVTIVKKSREDMLRALPEYQKLFKKYKHADDKITGSLKVTAILKAKAGVSKEDAKEFGVSRTTAAGALELKNKAIEVQKKVESGMEELETAATNRLFAGLQLLQAKSLEAKLSEASAYLEEINKYGSIEEYVGNFRRKSLRSLIHLRPDPLAQKEYFGVQFSFPHRRNRPL